MFWEYHIEELDLPSNLVRLNSLGAEGWELVAVMPLPAQKALFLFKRHKAQG